MAEPTDWTYKAPHEREVPDELWRAYHWVRVEFGYMAEAPSLLERKRRARQARDLLRMLARVATAEADSLHAEERLDDHAAENTPSTK